MRAPAEERRLVRRLLAGDGRAFETFAELYLPVLLRFARARLAGRADLAHEILHTTVCKAIENLPSFRGDSSLATWLCACCRNEILMHFRRDKVRSEVELTEAVVARAAGPRCGDPAAERRLLAREEARRVHSSLDRLPPRYAQVLEWKYVDDAPVKEIGARLGISPKAAESLLTRARNAFRTAFESADLEPKGASS